ncbi:hypothetical protein [Nonomuraea sp. bgisy101]|uniref:hypothetical protein n=1 Tax=Nonomuraea sp. bgisy101 TaxID=3413784 RepID=UPI003D7572D0
MNDRYQPGPLPPTGETDGDTFASDVNNPSADQERRSIDELTAEKITTARHAYYAAAAEAVIALQNGRFLSGEQVFAAASTQTSRVWWDLVDAQITLRRLTCDHALRRVRSWARHFLTGEAPAARPGTLFDHALAHASRMAARDFLAASGQLLTQHLASEPGERADVPAPDAPVDHDHPGEPAVPASVPATTAVAP